MNSSLWRHIEHFVEFVFVLQWNLWQSSHVLANHADKFLFKERKRFFFLPIFFIQLKSGIWSYLTSAFSPPSPCNLLLCGVQASRQRWWSSGRLRSWSSEALRPRGRWWCSTSPSSATGKRWPTVLTVPPRPPRWEPWPRSSAPSHPSPSTGRCFLQVRTKCRFNRHGFEYCGLHRATTTSKRPCRVWFFLFKILDMFFFIYTSSG